MSPGAHLRHRFLGRPARRPIEGLLALGLRHEVPGPLRFRRRAARLLYLALGRGHRLVPAPIRGLDVHLERAPAGGGLKRLLPERGEVAVEGGAFALEGAQGLRPADQVLFELAHLGALLTEADPDLLLGAGAGIQLEADPLLVAEGGAVLLARPFALPRRVGHAGFRERPVIEDPSPAVPGVGQAFRRQGEVAVEPAQLEPHAAQEAGDLGPLGFGRPAIAGGLLAQVLRIHHHVAGRGKRRRQLAVAVLAAGQLVGQLFEQAAAQGQLYRELLLGQLDVAFGLALLPGEAAQLGLDFGDQVLHPLQVEGGLLEPALGGLPAVAVEADARGFLEQRAPLVGTVGEEEVDHLRLDHHPGVAAEAGAPQQVLDVAQADRRAVEQVVALP